MIQCALANVQKDISMECFECGRSVKLNDAGLCKACERLQVELDKTNETDKQNHKSVEKMAETARESGVPADFVGVVVKMFNHGDLSYDLAIGEIEHLLIDFVFTSTDDWARFNIL
jgi:hypothetical protein